MNKIDIAGIAFGFIMSFTAWVRFFIHGADTGETFLAGILGLIIITQIWMHHNQTKLANTLYDVEEYLADLNLEEEDGDKRETD